jgi:hypothetical protein
MIYVDIWQISDIAIISHIATAVKCQEHASTESTEIEIKWGVEERPFPLSARE